MTVQGLGRLALRPRHRQAGDGDRLAPQGLPAVVDPEGSLGAAHPATQRSGGSARSRFSGSTLVRANKSLRQSIASRCGWPNQPAQPIRRRPARRSGAWAQDTPESRHQWRAKPDGREQIEGLDTLPYGHRVAGTTARPSAGYGPGCGGPSGRRPPPPLRTPGGVRSAGSVSSSGIGVSRGLVPSERTRCPA